LPRRPPLSTIRRTKRREIKQDDRKDILNGKEGTGLAAALAKEYQAQKGGFGVGGPAFGFHMWNLEKVNKFIIKKRLKNHPYHLSDIP